VTLTDALQASGWQQLRGECCLTRRQSRLRTGSQGKTQQRHELRLRQKLF